MGKLWVDVHPHPQIRDRVPQPILDRRLCQSARRVLHQSIWVGWWS